MKTRFKVGDEVYLYEWDRCAYLCNIVAIEYETRAIIRSRETALGVQNSRKETLNTINIYLAGDALIHRTKCMIVGDPKGVLAKDLDELRKLSKGKPVKLRTGCNDKGEVKFTMLFKEDKEWNFQ